MKVFLWIVGGIVVLVLVAGVVGWLALDSIVRGAVEKGGSHATGTRVKLAEADVGLRKARIDLGGLSIGNPEGFRDEPFVKIDGIHGAWQNGTVFSDELVIEELALDDVTVNLERAQGRTNFGKILEHIQTVGQDGEEPKPSEEGSKRTLVVQRIVVRNVVANVHLDGVPLAAGTAQVKVPRIELQEFRSDGSTKEILGKLTSTVVRAVLDSTVDAGSATLPKEILGELKGGLSDLKSKADDALDKVRDGLGDVKDLFKKN